ncbi:MAG: hypothetical protein ACM31P_13380 [Actinomycetota bacterium]
MNTTLITNGTLDTISASVTGTVLSNTAYQSDGQFGKGTNVSVFLVKN